MSKERRLTPFRFREVGDKMLVTNEVGDFGLYEKDIVGRIFSEELSDGEVKSLENQTVLINQEEDWKFSSILRTYREKVVENDNALSYLIVIPTLRCDLSCSYCQVSRAPLNASGYDWDEETLSNFERFLRSRGSNGMKIEFQGGEPTLRMDLVQRIVEIAEDAFCDCEFVICTNLTVISEELKGLLSKGNVVVSTSIDGPENVMTENRTFDSSISEKTLDNIKWIIENYGHEKIAALPTITESQISDPRAVIDYYRQYGFKSIFLRPVNYQGFARKSHSELSRQVDRWNIFYSEAMQYILEISETEYFEEFYTAIILRKIFARRGHGFVDFRSPARYSTRYCVIDYDGSIYPTDESRMLSRTRQVDLRIGSLNDGIDDDKVSVLNASAVHYVNEDCIHCSYLPYCGIDIIDDMSRYGRFDLPKNDTWFCRRHMFLYDFIFEKVASSDTRWLKLFNDWIHRSQQTSNALEIFQ